MTLLQGAFDGATVLLQSTLAMVVTVATFLALAPVTASRPAWRALLFCACALAVGWVQRPLPADAIAAGVSLVLGAGTAAGLRWRGWAAWAVLVLGGAAAGISGKMQTASWEEGLGAALLLLLLAFVMILAGRIAMPARLSGASALARRMSGAWVAALGVLMLALWIRGQGG
ncbi:hypothetical protein [Ramlibacter tataouinensis]|nr:hypothetical protein [Ramlibacter tataouinensis]